MGKGKKNKAKHAARKAVDKTKYITVEDVYEPRRGLDAAGSALDKTKEAVELDEPAGESKGLTGLGEHAGEPKILDDLVEPSGQPKHLPEFEDAFYGPSKPVGDVEKTSEPAGETDEEIEPVAAVEEIAEEVEEPAEPAGAIEEIEDATEEPIEPADAVGDVENVIEEPVELARALEEPAESAGEAEELAATTDEPAELVGEAEELAATTDEPAEFEGEAEEPVVPEDEAGDAEKQADDHAEVHHGAHVVLKKEEDAARETNREIVETASAETPKNETAKKFSLPIVVGVAVAALVVGLLVGAFLLGRAGGSAVTGKSVVSEGELDSPIASYSYQGKNDSITVREVIEQSTSLEAAKDADGNYQIPTADTALGVVRNKLLVAEAERQGITVTDEDVVEYAATNLGTDDFEVIANNYQMDVDAVKALLRETCMMARLRDTVAPVQDTAMPDSPEPPSSDDKDALTAPTKEYADYIIALAGDEWDAKKGTWASKDGPYASGLADAYEITAKGASYEAAMAAYYIAYQLYAQESAEAGTQWADYVNGILDNATIEIYTLLA